MNASIVIALVAAVTFHARTITQIIAEPPGAWRQMRTHVSVAGFVTYKVREEDGDLHLRLCDSPRVRGMDRRHCIVAECIPALPCLAPKVGDHVTVRGISRFDGEHGHSWWEVHPVVEIR